MDTKAPSIRVGALNRNRQNFMDQTSNISARKVRMPKGSRQAVRIANVGDDMEINALDKYDKEFAKKTELPDITEDMSDHYDDDMEEEKKQDGTMDIDGDKDEDDSSVIDDYDPWKNEEDDDNDNYTPITLKSRPSYGKHGVFESTEMLNVFKEKEDHGNEFMFIQMPQVLPLISRLTEDEKHRLSRGKKVKTSLLRQMGEGHIGKIRIRKSGKTELVIGDHVMDINFASPMDCYQQVMHIHCEMANDGSDDYRAKSQFLGNVPPQNNLVCSYRAEDLIR